MNKKIKVYIDSNLIFCPNKICNLDAKEAKAFEKILDNYMKYITLVTSEKTKEELEKISNVQGRCYTKFIYYLLSKVPKANLEIIRCSFGNISFGESVFGGSIREEDELYKELKKIFKNNDDAEHIFHAEKNKLDYFLTLDKRTILNKRNDEKFKHLNLRIRLVSPSELLDEIKKYSQLKNQKTK